LDHAVDRSDLRELLVVLSMSRRGRKRKLGLRNPKNRRGRLIHKRESPAARAAQMPHRRALAHPEDQLAENELGRMVLRGELDRLLGQAGQEYARLWREYLPTVEAPRRARLAGLGALLDCGGCQGLVGTQFCECEKRKRKWLEASRVLRQVGHGPTIWVQAVALNDEQCPFERLEMLRLGLVVLAAHFRLGSRLTKKANRPSNNRTSQTSEPLPTVR
jgi:hypothetical protein